MHSFRKYVVKHNYPLFAFFLIFFCGCVLYKYNKEYTKKERSYLKRETYIRLIDQKQFKMKLNQEPPLWMKEQIEDDFQSFQHGFSQTNVDVTFNTIQNNLPKHPFIARYRIIDNQLYRYFPKEQLIPTRDCGTEKAIKMLMRFIEFKDMDFIISYFDGIPIIDSISADVHITENKAHQAPVLFSAKVKGTPYIVLIPDWRSLSNWWARDIKNVNTKMKITPWETKKNKAVWRGSLTKHVRLKLCQIATQHPEIFNAKLNLQDPDPTIQNQIEEQGLFGGRLSRGQLLEHKYHPIVDGFCCAAPAFQWRLLSNSLTLKQESEEIQWFYRAVHPYVHYLPIANDLSDLIDKINWAKDHDDLCKTMAENSTNFILENLMMDDVYQYLYLVLKHYASLQIVDKKVLLNEVKTDPRWVNIQNRRSMYKKVKNKRLSGYSRDLINP